MGMTKTITVSISDELYEVWKTLPHGKRIEWFSEKLDEINKIQKLKGEVAIIFYEDNPLHGVTISFNNFLNAIIPKSDNVEDIKQGLKQSIIRSSIQNKLSGIEETSESRLDKIEDKIIEFSNRLESLEKHLIKSEIPNSASAVKENTLLNMLRRSVKEE